MITKDIVYVGADDKDLDLFEGQYPVPNGVSYNSYVILDEKIAVMDTVDKRKTEEFLANLDKVLAGRQPDYLVVNHVEPDHAANIQCLQEKYPDMQLVGNAKTFQMLLLYFPDLDLSRSVTVKEGDTLCLGRHTLHFVMAPMVHWPEVMMTYDDCDKVLFSADGFGKFGALDADEDWDCEARRYYFNIVGKYGPQVQALLKKAAGVEIAMICPLHGPIWRENTAWFVEKYQLWSTYTPEDRTAAIFCGSIYGHTENAAEIVANRLAERGVRNIALYDVAQTDLSQLVGEAFRCSHLVFASATYNNGLFTPMETLLLDLKAHNLQNRTVALVENGSWGPQAGKLMGELVSGMKNMTVLETSVTLKSAVKTEQREALEALADTLAADILQG